MKTENNLQKTESQSWDDCFLLGISAIDNQHFQLFNIFDKILNISEYCFDCEKMQLILEDLEKLSKTHFFDEELLMSDANFDQIELHRTQHLYFLEQVEYFKQTFKYCNSKLIEQLHEFIRKWILNHIYVEDAKYATTVKSHLLRDIDNWVI